MKKSLLITLIALIIMSCNNSNKNSANKADSANSTKALLAGGPGPIQTSLNGALVATAKTMVGGFRQKLGYYTRKTSVWFSKEYIDSLDAMLTNEQKADGIRIYLARLNQINTFILVTTSYGGRYPDDTLKKIHNDYFDHTAPFLQSPLVKEIDEDGNDNGGALLFTATPCPGESCDILAEHFISCKQAKADVQNFSATEPLNTYSEWFRSEVFHYLKKELDSAPASKKADGIRIYLGLRTTDKRHNFIIVTTGAFTKPNGDKIHLDYFECYASKEKLRGLDNGEQCPNNCKGTTLP